MQPSFQTLFSGERAKSETERELCGLIGARKRRAEEELRVRVKRRCVAIQSMGSTERNLVSIPHLS